MVSPEHGRDRDGQLVGWEAEIGSWKLSCMLVAGRVALAAGYARALLAGWAAAD